MKRRRPGIGTGVLLGALLLAAPFTGLLVWQTANRVEHDSRATEAAALDRARTVASDTERFVARTQSFLESLAKRPLVGAVDSSHCDPLFAPDTILSAGYANLILAGSSGQIVCSAVPQAGGPTSVADRPYFKDAMRTGAFTIGGLQLGRITGRWVVVLAQPVLDTAGRVVGVVGVPVDLIDFASAVIDVPAAADETVVLIDGSGTILTQVPGATRWAGQNDPRTGVVNSVLGGTEGTAREVGPDGTGRLVGYTTVPGTTWHVYAGIPTAVAFAQLSQDLSVGAALVLLAVALAIVLALVASRLIARPVRELAVATGRVATGDLTTRVHAGGFAETAALADSFNRMLDLRGAAEEGLARLGAAVAQATDAIVITDPDGSISYVNAAFERLSGYGSAEILGQNPRILRGGDQDPEFFRTMWTTLAAGRTWSGTLTNRRRDGSLFEVESVITPVRDVNGRLLNYVQIDRDVTRERQLESDLARDAREREAIEAALERIDPEGTPEAIAAASCAEIVRLPEIDSAWAVSLGADHGRVLAATGLIGTVLPAGHPVPGPRARLLLERSSAGPWTETWGPLPEDGAYGDAIAATGLHTVVHVPLRGAHGIVGVISFGAHDAGQAGRIVERLPTLATFGSIIGRFVAPGIETRHREADARAVIEGILDAQAFAPFFQPIVVLRDGAIVGYEALTRFAEGSLPDVLFAMADRAGLGEELETATLRAALKAASVLPPDAYLSVNASPELIHSGALQPLLADLDRSVVVEITEHAVVGDYLGLRRDLEALGPTVRLAVDDAGAGYASLRHVLELSPDIVKLDIGLVRGIDADPARQALIAGMGYFAVKRKVRLVAEGIETEAELKMLRSLGIWYGQGFLLGRPQDGRGPGPWPTRIALAHGRER